MSDGVNNNSGHAPARLRYLPALDGLRALAVAMVVAYHLDAPWARGGFLGVDLFFVISGFLITTLMLRERDDTGRLAVGSFWVRRFKRLVPPVVVMVTATVLATRIWGVSEQWNSVRFDAAAATGYVANWRFIIADQSYFDASLGPSPLRHTWSLALEEQWYFIWPLVVAALGSFAAVSARRRWIPAAVVAVLALLSAGLMAWMYDAVDPSRVYYGTDTRAQHLLVGALLAFVIQRVPALLTHGWVRSPLVMHTALVLFVVVASRVGDETSWLYRGGLLGLSMLASVVVLGVAVPGRKSALFWLGARPLVWLGRRSYAIYLWHWPVIVFVGPPMGWEFNGVALALLQVAITLVLADLSYRLVEAPARRPRRTNMPQLAGWSVGAVGSVLLAMIVLAAPGDRRAPIADVVRPTLPAPVAAAPVTPVAQEPAAPSTEVAPPSTAGGNASTDIEAASSDAASSASVLWPDAAEMSALYSESGTSQASAASAPQRLLLFGDSTAVVMSTGQPDSDRWQTEVFARLGCSTTRGVTIDAGADRPTEHADECAQWRADWSLSREIVQPDVSVVMVGAWEVLDHVIGDEIHRFPSAGWTLVVEHALRNAVRLAGGATEAHVYVTTLPCMQQPAKSDFSAQARNDIERVTAFNEVIGQIAADDDRVDVLPLDELLCPDGVPLTGSDGSNVRYDGVHLTAEGVSLTWEWMLDELSHRRSVPAT